MILSAVIQGGSPVHSTLLLPHLNKEENAPNIFWPSVKHLVCVCVCFGCSSCCCLRCEGWSVHRMWSVLTRWCSAGRSKLWRLGREQQEEQHYTLTPSQWCPTLTHWPPHQAATWPVPHSALHGYEPECGLFIVTIVHVYLSVLSGQTTVQGKKDLLNSLVCMGVTDG